MNASSTFRASAALKAEHSLLDDGVFIMSLPLTPPLSAFLFLLSFLQKLPPHRSLPLTLTDLTRPSNMTHPLVKVHQECSSKHVIIKNPFSFPKLEGKDAAPGLMERDCASASCTVVIASRSISLLPPSTGVTGVLILIVGLLLDVSFHLGSGAAVVARRITACCRCRPFIRGQMKLHREQ